MPNEFQALADKLTQLQGPLMREIQRKALKRVGEIVQTVVQFDCPEKTEDGGLLETGELKASIKARVHIASDQEIAEGKSSRVVIGPVGHTAQIVANWVENGHYGPRPKGIAQSDRARHDLATGNKFIPAHPFVRRAYDECHEAAEAAYIESVTEDLQKAIS